MRTGPSSSGSIIRFEAVDYGQINTGWVAQGFADFNGDGTDDFLWRSSTNGDVGLWLSNPAEGLGYHAETIVDLGVISLSWTIAGVGDFNGDGKADILWHNSSGDTGAWLSNAGSGYTGFTSVDFGMIPTSWSIVGVGDYNGDGKADVLWQNSDGQVGEWLSNPGSGFTGFTSVILNTVGSDWQIAAGDPSAANPPPNPLPSATLFTQAMAAHSDSAAQTAVAQAAMPQPAPPILAAVTG